MTECNCNKENNSKILPKGWSFAVMISADIHRLLMELSSADENSEEFKVCHAKLQQLKTIQKRFNSTFPEYNLSEYVVRQGFIQAMGDRELWVNTDTDEIVKFAVKDEELRNKLYCKECKIIIEVQK